LWVGGYHGPRKSIHSGKLPDFLRDFEPGALFVHNIEPIPDVRWDELEAVKQTVVGWSNQIRYMREARPDMLFSMYGVPQREYWSAAHGRADELAAWRAANDVWQPFIDMLNVITPSLYTFYDFAHVNNAGNNRRYIAANIAESRRVAKGKPVLPFVWADYHDSHQTLKGTPIDLEQWRAEVRLILSQADGVILWNYRPTAHAEHLKVLLEEAAK
jgi:hypothetical protein